MSGNASRDYVYVRYHGEDHPPIVAHYATLEEAQRYAEADRSDPRHHCDSAQIIGPGGVVLWEDAT